MKIRHIRPLAILLATFVSIAICIHVGEWVILTFGTLIGGCTFVIDSIIDNVSLPSKYRIEEIELWNNSSSNYHKRFFVNEYKMHTRFFLWWKIKEETKWDTVDYFDQYYTNIYFEKETAMRDIMKWIRNRKADERTRNLVIHDEITVSEELKKITL